MRLVTNWTDLSAHVASLMVTEVTTQYRQTIKTHHHLYSQSLTPSQSDPPWDTVQTLERILVRVGVQRAVHTPQQQSTCVSLLTCAQTEKSKWKSGERKASGTAERVCMRLRLQIDRGDIQRVPCSRVREQLCMPEPRVRCKKVCVCREHVHTQCFRRRQLRKNEPFQVIDPTTTKTIS